MTSRNEWPVVAAPWSSFRTYKTQYISVLRAAGDDRPTLKGPERFLLDVKQAIESAVALRGWRFRELAVPKPACGMAIGAVEAGTDQLRCEGL